MGDDFNSVMKKMEADLKAAEEAGICYFCANLLSCNRFFFLLDFFFTVKPELASLFPLIGEPPHLLTAPGSRVSTFLWIQLLPKIISASPPPENYVSCLILWPIRGSV